MRIIGLIGIAALASVFSGCGIPVAACSSGQLDCGGACVDYVNDPNNCGACGAVCTVGTACQAAVCVASNPFPHLGQPGGPVPTQGTVYRIQPGAGTVVQPGQMAGYGISANVGGSYRLVWTGDGNQSGQYREFWGSVYTPGHFTTITPGCGGVCAVQSDDQITAAQADGGGQRIDFDSTAADTINGFDFVIDAEPVYFDLIIDGTSYPSLVFFPATDNGGQISNVDAMPFGLTTN